MFPPYNMSVPPFLSQPNSGQLLSESEKAEYDINLEKKTM